MSKGRSEKSPTSARGRSPLEFAPWAPLLAQGHIPVLRPQPPRLSEHLAELAEIEQSGIFTNYGPVNTRFEQELASSIFRGGECLTVCNATIGLMIAIRGVVGEQRPAERRYALMPSFTFAATAQAALWCGLTPLLCDIDPETWLPDAGSEDALLTQYADQIAVIVPYATFGNNLDLSRYQRISEEQGIPIVVDAAASMGSQDDSGAAFGTGFRWPVVFSMHATKVFSVGEGGIIYCADSLCLQRLRSMGSFGFEGSRSSAMIGLNSKLSEVSALTALLKLRSFSSTVQQCRAFSRQYERELKQHVVLQRQVGRHQAKAFQSILLPRQLVPTRAAFMRLLRSRDIGSATYFSPHLAEQPFLKANSVAGPLPNTEDIASRIVTLPLFADMTAQQVSYVTESVEEITSSILSGKKFELRERSFRTNIRDIA